MNLAIGLLIVVLLIAIIFISMIDINQHNSQKVVQAKVRDSVPSIHQKAEKHFQSVESSLKNVQLKSTKPAHNQNNVLKTLVQEYS